MNDKEFEALLSDSVRTYGHEYFNPPDNISREVHRFPDGFLDDISQQQPQKPFLLRHLRSISAMAAVLVVAVAAVLILPRIGNRSSDNTMVLTSEVPSKTASELTIVNDKEIPISETPSAIQHDSTGEKINNAAEAPDSRQIINKGETGQKEYPHFSAENSAGAFRPTESDKFHEAVPSAQEQLPSFSVKAVIKNSQIILNKQQEAALFPLFTSAINPDNQVDLMVDDVSTFEQDGLVVTVTLQDPMAIAITGTDGYITTDHMVFVLIEDTGLVICQGIYEVPEKTLQQICSVLGVGEDTLFDFDFDE